jgi:Thiopurine S-methyltransferase (TPMT)
MTDAAKWNDRYQKADIPWDTGRPSSELQRILKAHNIRLCRALELGCGKGTAGHRWLLGQRPPGYPSVSPGASDACGIPRQDSGRKTGRSGNR